MNLTSRKARRTAIALGSTAAVIAGGAAATSAFASPTALTLTPNVSSITILNTNPEGGADNWRSASMYGLELGGLADATHKVCAQYLTGSVLHGTPALQLTETAGTTPTGGATFFDVNGTTTIADTTSTGTAGDTMWIGAAVPGTYTMRFFEDEAVGGNCTAYSSNVDPASPTITVHVLDGNNTTAAASGYTADDWTPSVTATGGDLGRPVTTSISASGLTVEDARGDDSNGYGKLGDALGAMAQVISNGAGLVNDTATGSYNGSAFVVQSADTTAAGTVSGVVSLEDSGGTDVTSDPLVTRQVVVNDNFVQTLHFAAPSVTGSVEGNTSGNDALTVKTGVRAVTYTATVTALSGGNTNYAGKVVYFTLGGGDGSHLTTSGTTVDATNHVFSATTNSSGVASLTVTDGATTPASYTVAAESNNVAATDSHGGGTLTATYADAIASTLTLTNTPAQLVAAPGSSVTITGILKNQFGAGFRPSGGDGVNLTLGSDSGVASIGSDGTFSFMYTPSTTPTAGSTTSVSVTETANGIGPSTETIGWSSSAAPSTVNFTNQTAASLAGNLTLQRSGTDPTGHGTTVTGTVVDSNGAPVLYHSVTVTGPGMYFEPTGTDPSASSRLVSSITTTTDGSGNFTVDAYPTHAGFPSLTATAGSATATLTATSALTANAADGYALTVTGASGLPGSTLTITGTLHDAFGNPVAGVVDLSIDGSTLGALANSSVTAGSNGVFSTTFASGATANGTATLTATVDGLTADPSADSSWATDGVTIPTGNYQATSAITVSAHPDTVILSGPTSRIGRGNVTLSGRTTAGLTVKFYSKNAGSSDGFAFIGAAVAGSDGTFAKVFTIANSKTFVASVDSDGTYSNEITVRVVPPAVLHSTAALGAKALGHGRVRLFGNGGPTGHGTLKFYKKVRSHWVLVASATGNVHGDATVIIRTSRGTATFKVVYTAPGRTAAGATVTLRVR